MPEPIIIYDYNPQWPDMYETERRRICDVIGNKILAIEHIGSTAVPRLGAKPIIDIMVAVNHMSDSLKCKEPLIKLGYVYHFWPAFPERCFFCESSIGASKYHIHEPVAQTPPYRCDIGW